jgi:uncharacterized alpha-E superfamily protein
VLILLQREVERQKQAQRAQKDVQRVLQQATDSENKLDVALKVGLTALCVVPACTHVDSIPRIDRASQAATGAAEQTAQQEEEGGRLSEAQDVALYVWLVTEKSVRASLCSCIRRAARNAIRWLGRIANAAIELRLYL